LKSITTYKRKEDGESEGKAFSSTTLSNARKKTGENDTPKNFIISSLCEMVLFF